MQRDPDQEMVQEAPAAQRGGRAGWVIGMICAAAFWVSLALCMANNGFPYQYHPDELSKAEQVRSGEWNFHHPLLLVRSSRLVARAVLGSRLEAQPVVEVGRGVSAFFAAAGVAALVAAAGIMAGVCGAGSAALALVFCAPLVAQAHYMKEDAALVFGMALTLLGGAVFARRAGQSARCAALLGAGAALAASAKYAGLVMSGFGLAFAAACPANKRGRLRGAAWFGTAFLLALAAVNGPALLHSDTFRSAAQGEVNHAFSDHLGLGLPIPNVWLVRSALQQTPWYVVLLALASPLALVGSPRATGERRRWFLLAAGLAGGYAAGLCFTVIPFSRYCLPVVVMLNLIAALGVGWTLERMGRRARWIAGVCLAGVLVADQGVVCARYVHQFGNDSRRLARAWLVEHGPTQGLICQDATAALSLDLPGHAKIDKARILSSQYAADLGSVNDLVTSGVRAVVICDLSYARYRRPGLKAAPGKEAEFERRRRWYQELITKQKPAWISAAAQRVPGPTNPEVRIYLLEPR